MLSKDRVNPEQISPLKITQLILPMSAKDQCDSLNMCHVIYHKACIYIYREDSSTII